MPEKILIIDDDLDTLRLVGLMLQKQGYQIVAAGSGPQGLELAAAELPDLILLDVMMPGMDGYEVARRLRSNEKTARIGILMFTAKSQLDDKVTGFEAGADDYLTKPTHPSELQAHVRALLGRTNKGSPPALVVSEEPAYMIGVIAARGGLGVTTVASNLAAALARKSGVDVIVAEYRPGQGTLCYDLKLEQKDGLSQLLETHPADITRKLVEEALIHHTSGIRILAASGQPKDGLQLDKREQFDVILSRLKFVARLVIVDLGSGLGPLNQKLALLFNELIVVAEPMDISLQHSRALLDDLVELGVDRSHLYVAVNYRIRSDAQLSVPQVQERINYPVDVTFTPAPELLIQASRRQTLACLVTVESLTTQQYNSLAAKVEARAPHIAKK
jgi:pilus assembly protein CpaE